jgi:hypothetical protein
MFFIITIFINVVKIFHCRNPGPFNGFNFPGAPQPVLLMENFMSAAAATTAIDSMFTGTSDHNIHPLHLLAEIIIFSLLPWSHHYHWNESTW